MEARAKEAATAAESREVMARAAAVRLAAARMAGGEGGDD